MLPCSLWFVYVGPSFSFLTSILISAAVGVSLLNVILWLVLTHITEPGILQVELDSEHDTFYVIQNSQRCDPLQFRAKFCRETDNCIESFDHFCPWVGNAIGRRNYRYFFLFLLSITTLDMLVLASSTAHIAMVAKSNSADHVLKAFEHNIPVAFIVFFGLLISLLIIPLFARHVHLVAINQTTNESIKNVFSDSSNPHDRGCPRNYATILCSPIRQSFVRGEMAHLMDNA
jgi:hypothetical protein